MNKIRKPIAISANRGDEYRQRWDERAFVSSANCSQHYQAICEYADKEAEHRLVEQVAHVVRTAFATCTVLDASARATIVIEKVPRPP